MSLQNEAVVSNERTGSPGKTVKLNAELMKFAEQEALVAQRSTPKQLEYWALLGRVVERYVRKDDCHSLMAEVKVISSLTLADAFPTTDSVMAGLEDSRSAGTLAASVTSAEVVYEIDESRENGMAHWLMASLWSDLKTKCNECCE